MTFPLSRRALTVLMLLASCTFRRGGGQTLQSTVAAADAASFPTSVLPPPWPDAPSSVQQNPGPQQTPAPAPANETEEQRKIRERREEAEREVREEEKQRFGGVVPQFNVVVTGKAVPLTARQKFDISFHTLKDPYTIALAFVVGGGIGELQDSHTGYGHGPAGFFKRVGASYADSVNGNLIGNALLPSLLHQDPRYFRKGTGSIPSRIVYSALTSFICKGDNGKTQPNISNVLGNYLSGAISNAYYPSDERGLKLTLENGTTVTLEGMVGAQLLEFAPDVSSYVHKRREHHRLVLAEQARQQQAATPPGAARAGVQPQ